MNIAKYGMIFQVWSSRDVTYIVLFSALSVVNLATVIQFFSIVVPVPGIGYGVDIIGAILGGVAFLLYRERRWRLLAQGTLIALLTMPFTIGGLAAGNIIVRIPIILRMLILDVVFMSFYGSFKRRNKLLWLTILQLLFFFTVGPFIGMLFFSLFIPFELLWPIYFSVLLMLPLIIVLTVIGGYTGYKIYERVEKIA
jgi:hypothetical protein